jgi:hypothetical protein
MKLSVSLSVAAVRFRCWFGPLHRNQQNRRALGNARRGLSVSSEARAHPAVAHIKHTSETALNAC